MPRKQWNRIIVLFLVPLALIAITLIGLLSYQHIMLNTVTKQTYQTLRDLTREQVGLLNTKLNGNYTLLESFSTMLSTSPSTNQAELAQRASALAANSTFTHLLIIDPNGHAWVSDGRTVDTAGRAYLTHALSGRRAIERVSSRLDAGVTRFLLAVPIRKNGVVAGVLAGALEESAFRDLLTSQAFSQNAYTFVCETDGNIVIGSDNARFSSAEHNLLKFLEQNDPDAQRTLVMDLAAKRAGVLRYRVDGEDRYATYTPTGINDWFLFNVIPGSIVKAAERDVTNAGIRPLILVMILTFLVLGILFATEMLGRRRLEAENLVLQEQSLRDALTGLFTRSAVAERVDAALATGGDHALYLIDLNHLRLLNETLGHIEGDALMRRIADMLRAYFGVDSLLGRTGGDEFIAYVPGANAQQTARELCDRLHFAYQANEQKVSVSVTIGMAPATTAHDFDRLYKEADLALYHAKSLGQPFSVFDPENMMQTGAAIQLQALLTHINGGILLFELGEVIRPLYISPSYYAMEGVDANETMEYQSSIYKLVYPEDFPRFESALRMAGETGEVADLVYRNIMRTGSIGWRHLRAVRIEYPQSRYPVLIVILTDVTELKENEENLKLAFDQTDLRLWEYDLQSCCLTGQKMQSAQTDLPESNIESGYIHPSSAEEYRAFFADIHAGVPNGSLVLRLRTREDDTYEWYRLSYRSLLDAAGMPYKAVGITAPLPNITAAKTRFDQEKLLAEALGETLLASMRANLTRNTLETFHVRDDPRFAGRTFATYDSFYTMAESLVAGNDDRFVYQARVSRAALLRAHVQGNTWVVVEYRRRDSAGREVWVSNATNLIEDPVNGDVYAFSYLRDVSARHAWEENLPARVERDAATYLYTPESTEALVKSLLAWSDTGLCGFVLLGLSGENTDVPLEDKTLFELARILRLLLDNRAVIGHISKGRFALYFPSVGSLRWVEDEVQSALAAINRTRRVVDLTEHVRFTVGLAVESVQTVTYAMLLELARTSLEQNYHADPLTRHISERASATVLDLTQPVPDSDQVLPDPTAPLDLAAQASLQAALVAIITAPDFDTGLMAVFPILGEYYKSERIYTLLIGDDGASVSCAHEWHTPLLRPIAQQLQHRAIGELPIVQKAFETRRVVFLRANSDTVQNVLIHPIFDHDLLLGFFCIEAPRAHLGDAGLLTALLPALLRESEKHREVNAQMQTAARRDLKASLAAGHFKLYLQPCFDLKTGALVGAEALVRRLGTNGRLLTPKEFFPALERFELTRYVDSFILEEVLDRMTAWDSSGKPPLPVSVNLAPGTLSEPRTLASLLALHARYEIPAERIFFEVNDQRDSYATCQALKEQGFKLTLDNFCSGRGTTAALAALRFDLVKIDTSITRRITLDEPSRIIVRHSIELARDLNLICAAEGVEQPGDRAMLLELGCIQGQGRLFDLPLPADEFEQKYL